MVRLWLGALGALCVSLSAAPAQAQSIGSILDKMVERTQSGASKQRAPSPSRSMGNNSVTIDGVTFPQGNISFADEVVSYTPGSPAPTNPHQGTDKALGLPDYNGRSSCSSQASCSFVSLGSGGTLVVRFTDNVLTGSGNGDIDLWVFEVGPQVEDMFVEISSDGRSWHSVGAIGGGKSGVDIDAFGFGSDSAFRYVRLRDDPAKGGQSGATVGADIDAIGAISTRSEAECACPERGRSASASAETFGDVLFPQGAISFADQVVSFKRGSPAPSAPHVRAENALGVPDYRSGSNCSSAASCRFVSLGSGGSLVVRFTDNVLTGSGNSDIDLWVFEIGPDVEDMSIDISPDGRTWHSVGAIGGGRSGVDIDAFGFGPTTSFAYVRLTDDPNKGERSGATAGADIDAVGAISTRPAAGCNCARSR